MPRLRMRQQPQFGLAFVENVGQRYQVLARLCQEHGQYAHAPRVRRSARGTWLRRARPTTAAGEPSRSTQAHF
ncbi:TPA: hypothetical protein ACN1XC_002945 [Yersinia enterocolitica]